jgi:histidine triad (HIT) family protein
MCVFCRIATGESPAAVVFSDDVAVGFLDTAPVFKGHVLVVPRLHVITLADLSLAEVGPFFLRVQSIAAALPPALAAHGTFVAMNNVVSQSVPHLHCHVIPRVRKDGLRGFFWPRLKYESPDEMEHYRSTIADSLAG